MSADLVVRCRAEIDRLRKLAQDEPWTVTPWELDALTAFTAILDQHGTYEAHGWDDGLDGVDPEVLCTTCEMSPPCPTVRAVAAALGVGGQETAS